MTDGIIQQVFKPYLDTAEYFQIVFTKKDLLKFKQELIENIKQELNDHQSCLDDGCTLREHLIGDNE